MITADQLAGMIRELRLPEFGDTAVATHAVVQPVDAHTVVVVAFAGHTTHVIEAAIRDRHRGVTDISTANDVITIGI